MYFFQNTTVVKEETYERHNNAGRTSVKFTALTYIIVQLVCAYHIRKMRRLFLTHLNHFG
jgi:hypothetical protein